MFHQLQICFYSCSVVNNNIGNAAHLILKNALIEIAQIDKEYFL